MFLITFFVLQLLAIVSCAEDDDSKCISLANSKTCSAFSQFYVSLPNLQNNFPFLINTTTLEEFDLRLLEYVNSTSDYLFPLGCLSSNYNPTIPYARYSLTRLCIAVIQDPDYSLPCNFNNGLTPPPLCQTTCNAWVESVDRITENPHVCSDTTQRNNTLAYYRDQCNTWEGLNGTIAENCISGIANEPYSCGFGNDTRAACTYCKDHSDDKCCQQVTYCKKSLSAGAIVGIVIGSLVGAALIIFSGIWCYCRKRRHYPMNPFHQFMSSNNSSAASQPGKPNNNNANINNSSVNTIANNANNIITPMKATKINDSPFATDKIEIASDFSTIPQALNTTDSTTVVPSSNDTPLNEEFFVVIHPYPPQMPDELALNPGDIICLALYFDDGWALGYNVTTGLKGAFPLVCISPAPEESLNQLLDMENSLPPSHELSQIQSNPSTLQSTMEKIRQNVRRSVSLGSYSNNHSTDSIHHTNSLHVNNHHDSIPKRSASYKSYDYLEVDSPSSPTLHTPFFDDNMQPAKVQHNNITSNIESQRKPSPP